jgi:hypothetical protein
VPEVQAQTGRRVYSAWSAPVTITIGGVARAVTEVVRAPDTTVADLQGLAVALEAALREAVRLRAEVAAAAGSPNLTLATYRWTVAGSLAGLVGALIALLALVQSTIADAQPDPPPNVTVVVERPDPGEVGRQVDERLRELEQQREAKHDTDPGSPSTGR